MPLWGKLLIGLAFIGVLYGIYWKVDNALEHHYADPVRAAWAEAVAAQEKREAKAAAEADDFQRRADVKRNADFKLQLARREKELLARLAAQPISSDVTGELRGSVRVSNEGAGKPAQANPTPAGATDGRALVEWFDDVASLYRACRERVDGWVKWDDERVKQ